MPSVLFDNKAAICLVLETALLFLETALWFLETALLFVETSGLFCLSQYNVSYMIRFMDEFRLAKLVCQKVH